MILLYILGAILTLLLLYVLFLSVCCLFVNPEKEYDRNSPFYRFLLNTATAATIKLLRIHVHTNGIEKIPKDAKVLFVCNHRSNFDPILTWYALKKWKIAFISKPSNFKIPFFRQDVLNSVPWRRQTALPLCVPKYIQGRACAA